MWDIQLSAQQVDALILDLIRKHASDVEVNEMEFLDLLKYSLSLSFFDKKRVLEAIPTLSQYQFDELKKVFLEEREEFKKLSQEHPEDIKKLVEKQSEEWQQLGEYYYFEMQKSSVVENDEKKLEEIKKQLGI